MTTKRKRGLRAAAVKRIVAQRADAYSTHSCAQVFTGLGFPEIAKQVIAKQVRVRAAYVRRPFPHTQPGKWRLWSTTALPSGLIRYELHCPEDELYCQLTLDAAGNVVSEEFQDGIKE